MVCIIFYLTISTWCLKLLVLTFWVIISAIPYLSVKSFSFETRIYQSGIMHDIVVCSKTVDDGIQQHYHAWLHTEGPHTLVRQPCALCYNGIAIQVQASQSGVTATCNGRTDPAEVLQDRWTHLNMWRGFQDGNHFYARSSFTMRKHSECM